MNLNESLGQLLPREEGWNFYEVAEVRVGRREAAEIGELRESGDS
jgi:hypothetical protein